MLPEGAKLMKVFDDGYLLTEGVAGHDGFMYVSDITCTAACKDESGKYLQAGNIFKYDPQTGETTVFRSPSGMSALETLRAGAGVHHIILGEPAHGEAQAMPTYVYRCVQCGDTFEQTETISEHGATKPSCPKCGSDKVAGVPTAFVAVTGKKS